MNKFETLRQNVINWSTERGIFDPEHGSSAEKQYLKFLSEFGELSSAILANDKEKIKDGIGDSIVCLINIAKFANAAIQIEDAESEEEHAKAGQELKDDEEVSLLQTVLAYSLQYMIEPAIFGLLILESKLGFKENECLQFAYNEIKDRKGKMINGAFVKETK